MKKNISLSVPEISSQVSRSFLLPWNMLCSLLQLCSSPAVTTLPLPPSLPPSLPPCLPLENPDMIHAAAGALTKEIVQWQKPALIIDNIFFNLKMYFIGQCWQNVSKTEILIFFENSSLKIISIPTTYTTTSPNWVFECLRFAGRQTELADLCQDDRQDLRIFGGEWRLTSLQQLVSVSLVLHVCNCFKTSCTTGKLFNRRTSLSLSSSQCSIFSIVRGGRREERERVVQWWRIQ